MKTFSIIVPVYQNAANLPQTLPRLLALAAALPAYQLELVLVDDGSTDGSRSLLVQAATEHPAIVRVVFLTRNFGQTPAIQAGLRHATGDCVGIISCDLQEPCEAFVEMVRWWEQGDRFVIGERSERREGAGHQRLSSIYWSLVRKFAFEDFPELGYDFCLIDRQVAMDVSAINEKNSSIFVLIYWLGYRPRRLPIVRAVRTQGRSQWRLARKVGFTLDTLIGFTYLPARAITLLGCGIALLALVYLAFVLTRWATLRAAPPGWMTVVGLVTALGALNLFALGVLSEYLLRILDEARKRPPFIVERVLGGADQASAGSPHR